EPPPGIATVADLIAWLTRRGDEYAHAFENPKVIRTAIDRAHVKADTAIAGAREIANHARHHPSAARAVRCRGRGGRAPTRAQRHRRHRHLHGHLPRRGE